MLVVFKIIKKCSNCKINYKLADYRKEDKLLKHCIKCRNSKNKSINKNKCIHDKIKYQCKDCNGLGVCIHNRLKYQCKICGDALDITIKNMVRQSKSNDKIKNRFDELNFINYLYVKNLIVHSNNKCYYCSCDLQYIKYDFNLATIERLNNDLGHNIGNCAIACLKCNFSRVGNNIN